MEEVERNGEDERPAGVQKEGRGNGKKIRKRKNGHERKIAECRRSNPKMFYAFINRSKKTRNKIEPLLDL